MKVWINKGYQSPIRNIAMFLTLMVVVTMTLSSSIPQYYDDQAPEYESAIEWMKNHNIQNKKVLCSKPHFTFFTDSSPVFYQSRRFKELEPNQFPRYLREMKPDYVIFDERYAAQLFPDFDFLLNTDDQPFDDLLKLVHKVNEPCQVVIYRYIK